ncbi:MAG: EAL domain-containing protein [Lentihominibacter sp.]
MMIENITPYFQPQIDIETGRVAGIELLSRYRCEDGRILTPDKFLMAIKSAGLIEVHDLFMLEEACRLYNRFAEKDRELAEELIISVNFTRGHLKDAAFAQCVKQLVGMYNIPPGHIEIEITEKGEIENILKIKRSVDEIREAGLRVAIDDFGTGCSDLLFLREIEFDTIKIDRAFLKQPIERRELIVLEGIIKLARATDTRIIAEGVETSYTKDIVSSLGVRLVQGWYFAEALPEKELEEQIFTRNSGL